MRNLFILKKENEAIIDRVFRDIRNLFEHEEQDYYKPVEHVIFGATIILNMKVTVIEIKHCQLKNISMMSDHT